MRRRSLQFRNILAILAAAAFVATFFGLAYKNTPTTDAAVKATDFKAGRIIPTKYWLALQLILKSSTKTSANILQIRKKLRGR